MTRFRKILFPVDLSEASTLMVPLVRDCVDQFQAEIHLVFVARVFGYFSTI